jgi:hypothetical protein
MKTVHIMFILCLFLLVACDDKEDNGENQVNIKYLETVLGGCNAESNLRSNEVPFENDTVIISNIKDTLSIFIGHNYSCGAPFKTSHEITDEGISVNIIDTCATMDCYQRCSCYYTFDYKFIQQNKNNYKCKILLFDPRKAEPEILFDKEISY